MGEVKLEGWKCERCGHIWPKTMNDSGFLIPRTCAKCHNPYWEVPRKKKKE